MDLNVSSVRADTFNAFTKCFVVAAVGTICATGVAAMTFSILGKMPFNSQMSVWKASVIAGSSCGAFFVIMAGSSGIAHIYYGYHMRHPKKPLPSLDQPTITVPTS